jgi:hypothetical protein
MANSIKEIKTERLSNLTQMINKMFNYITDNNIIKGNIILGIDYLVILIYFLLVFIVQLNRLNIILLVCLIIINICVNLYFGKWDTSLLVKLEQYFYNDLDWYGINTIFFKKFGLDRENHKYMQIFNIIMWILLFSYYMYRIFKRFFSKNSIKQQKVSDNKKQQKVSDNK